MSQNDPRITESGRMTASVFLEIRSKLFDALQELDAEISKTLSYTKSKRAAEQARQLFTDRAQLVDELASFGIDIDPHPALKI
jgi:hypothetical protein